MQASSLPRKKARSLRRKSKAPLIALIAVLAAILIAGLVIGIHSYNMARTYRQYPLRYKAQIIENANRFELAPWHVAAVVRCESSFDPKATSSVGARGLMQIMPDTGEWLAGKFGEADGFDPESLYDPDTNLKYGCWYLNWLMSRFDGDLILTTCAYHAGHGTVDKWLQNSEVSADGKTIAQENIPYDSTRTYVGRVLKAYEKYEELYDYEA